jgi:uncharacterized membrane protein YraQ (UPF0718 family)
MSDMTDLSNNQNKAQWRPGKQIVWISLLGIGIVIYIVLQPESALAAARFTLENLIFVSPMIVLGVLLTAGITASGSMALIAASFKGHEVRMIGIASLVGAFTPVCGITVLPLVAGLLMARVPLAPIMAFWLSSPVTDPGMLAITASALGVPFAIGKSVAAFFAGILAGGTTLVLTRLGYLADPARPTLSSFTQSTCSAEESESVLWQFWKESGRRRIFIGTAKATGKLMLLWLTLAFLAEYVLQAFLPPDLLGQYVGSENDFAVPIAALVGAPIYLDGYAALPLVRGLIDSGMAQDAAMAFLVAGGIISAWAAIPVFALVRLPVFALYVVLAIVSAMLAGWGFGLFV